MIGLTVTGRSIKVVSTFLPLKWNLVTVQAAKRPKTVLNARAQRVARTVSLNNVYGKQSYE